MDFLFADYDPNEWTLPRYVIPDRLLPQPYWVALPCLKDLSAQEAISVALQNRQLTVEHLKPISLRAIHKNTGVAVEFKLCSLCPDKVYNPLFPGHKCHENSLEHLESLAEFLRVDADSFTQFSCDKCRFCFDTCDDLQEHQIFCQTVRTFPIATTTPASTFEPSMDVEEEISPAVSSEYEWGYNLTNAMGLCNMDWFHLASYGDLGGY
ncbi:hypothetical protein QCA50_009700 [Cerrena zonata]|uniref:C2H2-type domain-containing protein n=1 Tax=Cerrena zonata TaxID=2478898 RepID=A0AAW0GC66_9APHY